jgi:choline dehydrogenase-like flavoprotein
VVVAGGAVETPRLLLLSGFDHPLIGRHLMTHFQTIVVGSFAGYRFHGERGRAVTEMHDDALIQDDGSRAAAKTGGLPWIKGGMVEHGGPALPIMEAKIYHWGRSHKDRMRSSPMRERLWAFTMQGEDLPVPTNRIDLDPTVRDVRGFPVARYTYRPHQHELVASAHHGPKLAGILETMGAEWTSIVTSPGVKGGPGERTTEHAPMSRHVMGTVRMGSDPDTSVTDRMGRLHRFENVVIADSSVFVTSSGYGPTLTLAALAARAAAAMVG